MLGPVATKFQDVIGRSRSTSYEFLPGVIRGAALLPTAATTNGVYNLFSLNKGGLGNSYHLSNIESAAGQMPSDQEFVVDGFKFCLFLAGAYSAGNSLNVEQVKQVVEQATFKFFVNGKPKTEGWLYSLMVPTVLWGSGTETIDLALNTIAFKNISHNPIGLPASISFDVAVTLTNPTLTASTYLVCELLGTRKIALG